MRRPQTGGLVVLTLLLACAEPAPAGPSPATPPPGTATPPHPPLPGTAPPPTGAEKSPVIPADSPAWAQMNGFVPDPAFYGEHSWDDVRMRVVGHVATIRRDLARARAMVSDWKGCADGYLALIEHLQRIPTQSSTGAPIRAALLAAADRDRLACQSRAPGAAPLPVGAGVAGLRAAWLNDAPPSTLAQLAAAIPTDRPDLTLDGFADFDQRHALRVRLVEAWADTADPFWPAEPWGYWTPAEIGLQVQALQDTAAAREPDAPGRRLVGLRGVAPITATSLGALPTGDSLVDTAGFPGPRAIGELAVLGLNDPAHRSWLDTQAASLSSADPAQLVVGIAAMVETLNQKPYGSRYYNIKQARNAGVRALAERGAYEQALVVLGTSWPLHHQDWACPNREGILRAIEGRLRLLAEDPSAEATLREALAASDRFLAQIQAAERR